MEKLSQRNECLDFLKGVACIFVVFMHAEFPGKIGILAQCVSRFAVPLFFMVSGYFCRLKSNEKEYVSKYISKKALHILKIIVVSCAVYFVYEIIFALKYGTLTALFSEVSIRTLFNFFVFNEPFIINGSLWFLFALLYCYVLYFLVHKWKNVYFKLLPLFFVVFFFLGQGLHCLGIQIPNYFYRNFLLEGMPFFMLGNYLYYNSDKIKVSNKTLIIALIVSTLLCPVERYLFQRDFGVNFCSLIQCLSMFLFALYNPSKKILNPICKLGVKYSLFVYIMHRMVMEILGKMGGYLGLNNYKLYNYSMPIIVLLLTVICGIIFYYIIDIFNKKLRGKKI